MNTLKNVLFFGLLLVALGGVYVALSRSPEQQPLPKGLSGDTTPPKIELGQVGATVTNISNTPVTSGPPAFPAQPPTLSTPPATLGTEAPPYKPSAATNMPPLTPGGDSATLAAPPVDPLPPPAAATSAPPRSNYPAGVADPFASGGGSASVPPLGALPPPPSEHSTAASLDLVMQQVKMKVTENRYADALLILSQLYGSPDLPANQSREVSQILDQMAGKVIYSREHWLDSPYLVQTGDTMDSIADRYQVPALLLMRINGIRDPQNVPPGKELKVLKGPFSAQISTERSELTMMLDGRYASRFNIVLSKDLGHTTAMCTVRDKRDQLTASGSGPGKLWIELSHAGGTITMQGTNDTGVASSSTSRNTIWLTEQDMDDVSGILSKGSRVIIQR